MGRKKRVNSGPFVLFMFLPIHPTNSVFSIVATSVPVLRAEVSSPLTAAPPSTGRAALQKLNLFISLILSIPAHTVRRGQGLSVAGCCRGKFRRPFAQLGEVHFTVALIPVFELAATRQRLAGFDERQRLL